MQVGMGFWGSKTLLSAVELELFTKLGGEPMTGPRVAEELGLHPRAIPDFGDSDKSSPGSTGRWSRGRKIAVSGAEA
jgi:hypothetical protein